MPEFILKMSNINNTELLKGLRDTAKVQNAESIPTQLAEKVLPVIITNPHPNMTINFSTVISPLIP